MTAEYRISQRDAARSGSAIGTAVSAFLLCVLLASPARPQQLVDAVANPYVDDEREAPGGPEPARTNAPPPRTVDDITQSLQRYKPDPAKAERDRLAVRAEPPGGADKQALFDFYLKRAKAAQRIGLLSQTIADLRLAEGVAPTGQDRGQARNLLWEAEVSGGNYLKAIAINENEGARKQGGGRALRSSGPPAVASVRVCNLAFLRAQLGDVEQAKQDLSTCESALQARRDADRGLDARIIARTQAAVFAAAGNLAEAEAAARRALAEMEAFLPTVAGRAQQGLLGNLAYIRIVRDSDERRLAEILLLRGKLVEAEIAIRNVLRSRLASGGLYTLGTGWALTVFSRVVFEQGRFKDAASLGIAAVNSLEQAGAVPESLPLVAARKTYAAALAAQQRWDEAISEFGKMQTGLERDPLLARKYGIGDVNWAWALIRTGKPEAALRMLEPMIERTRQRLGEKSYELAELRGFYALALASTDRTRALKEFAAAVPVLLEQSRADDTSEGGGIARTLRRAQILEGYIALLADVAAAGGSAGGVNAFDESFRLADAARGSGVQRALSASAARAQISDAQLAALARKEQDAEQRIVTLTDLLNQVLSAPPDEQLPKAIGDMRKEIEALHASSSALKREIQQRFPAYANLVDPAPATVAQTRAALRPGEVLVSIYVGNSATYVWAVPRQGEPKLAVAKAGEREIATTVAHLRQALDVGEISDLDRMPAYDVAAAHALYKAILLPVVPAWKDATSVIFVPHRALGQLPFALLVTEPAVLAHTPVPFAEYKPVAWLVRRTAVTQLPSINALIALRQLPPGKSDRQPFIGFGDPVFSKEQLALAPEQAIVTRGLRLRRAPVMGAGVTAAELAQLPALPDTAEEIRDIAGSLKANLHGDVFLGVAANEQNVKTADLASRAVVAFATHGLVPGDIAGLDQPALALSAPEVAHVDGDGLLRMDEVLALKLDADWVLLSACNTAAGDGAGSEAVSGLGRAFFYAGARALLVSNWSVESTSARALTTEIFRRQAAQPSLSRAEALRQAMLALIDGPGYVDVKSGKPVFSYAHPLFWAPFSLVGDGGAR